MPGRRSDELIESTTPKAIEGKWQTEKIVVLEFDTKDNADNFLMDDEVKKLFEIRHKTTDSNLIQVSGGSWREELPAAE